MNLSWICNNYCQKVSNDSEKEAVINYLYNNVALYNHRFVILKKSILTDKNIEITDNKYYISVNVTSNVRKNESLKKLGEQYYLIFLNNKKYLINKKQLFYQKHKINISKLQINIISLDMSSDIYNNGTIIDGSTLLSKNNTWIFLVCDIFMYKGYNYCKLDFLEKNILFQEFINDIRNKENNTFNVQCAPIIKLKNIKQFINHQVNNLNYAVNGLTFLPKNNGERIIYRFYKNKNKNKNNSSKANYENTQNIISKSDNNFELKITNLTDVYILYKVIHNKKEKIGMARIPNKQLSKELYNYFNKNKNKETVNVFCKFSEKFNKYCVENIQYS